MSLHTCGQTIETAKAKAAYDDAIDVLNYAQNRHLVNPRSTSHARAHDKAREAKDRAKLAYRQAKFDAIMDGDL